MKTNDMTPIWFAVGCLQCWRPRSWPVVSQCTPHSMMYGDEHIEIFWLKVLGRNASSSVKFVVDSWEISYGRRHEFCRWRRSFPNGAALTSHSFYRDWFEQISLEGINIGNRCRCLDKRHQHLQNTKQIHEHHIYNWIRTQFINSSILYLTLQKWDSSAHQRNQPAQANKSPVHTEVYEIFKPEHTLSGWVKVRLSETTHTAQRSIKNELDEHQVKHWSWEHERRNSSNTNHDSWLKTWPLDCRTTMNIFVQLTHTLRLSTFLQITLDKEATWLSHVPTLTGYVVYREDLQLHSNVDQLSVLPRTTYLDQPRHLLSSDSVSASLSSSIFPFQISTSRDPVSSHHHKLQDPPTYCRFQSAWSDFLIPVHHPTAFVTSYILPPTKIEAQQDPAVCWPSDTLSDEQIVFH